MKYAVFTSIGIFVALIICGLTTQLQAAPTYFANGKIAFSSSRDGNFEIYLMNSDGSGQTRLTNNTVGDYYPTWSPNGRTIAFIREHETGSSIKLMNADGTNERQINLALPLDPTGISWSPDGMKIAFSASNDIFTVNTDGSNLINVTNGQGQNSQPSWSPDGSQIAFTCFGNGSYSYGDICAVNSAGGTVRVIAYSFEYTSSDSPDWSPNGQKIVFSDASQAIAPNDSITLIKPDGTGLQRIFTVYDYSYVPAGTKWSPDGTKIVFFRFNYKSSDSQIMTINSNGSGLTSLTNNTGHNLSPDWQPITPSRSAFDFDGDGRADLSVYRPSDRVWYLNQSTNGFFAAQFGLSTDRITPADYDGDGRTDISVYRDGIWYWLKSSDNSFNALQFGIASDIPVPADYTGDDRAELAVYRSGVWWMLDLSNNQAQVVRFGLDGDKPVAADYDGDGRTDQAVYRDGFWHLNQSGQGYAVVQYGLPGDKPVIGDYDGDGKADPALYRGGTWYLLQSSQGSAAFQFGISTDIPVPADYDGDGRADIAIYRDGAWWIRQRSGGVSVQQFGLPNDHPVPAFFLP